MTYFVQDIVYLTCIALHYCNTGDLAEAIPRMFNASEKDKCLNVTIYHAAGLVGLYILYVVVSANFQAMMAFAGVGASKAAAGDNAEPAEVFNVISQPTADDVKRLEEADADRVAGVLAAIMGSPEPQQGQGQGQGQALAGSAVGSDSHMARSVTAHSMSLRRSVQFQRSAKYHPPKSMRAGAGAGMAEDEVAQQAQPQPLDWSHHRSTFVPDAPLYTWRSSAVHLPNLEDDDGLEGLVNIVTTPIRPPSACAQRCRGAGGRGGLKQELNTMAMAPKHLSAYLHRQGPACGGLFTTWTARYYTIDYLGFHSRKALSSPARGPHIDYTDLSDVISIDVTDKEGGCFQLLRRGGEKVVFLAPSVDILTSVVSRVEACMESLRHKTAYQRDEFVRTSSRELQNGFDCPDTQHVFRRFEGGDEGSAMDRAPAAAATSGVLSDLSESGQSGPHGGDHGHCLLDPPVVTPGEISSTLALGIHYILFPLKFMFYYSIPDVSSGKEGRDKYLTSILMSVFWLAMLSFVMIQCCDEIGKFIGASPIVMGLTLSAVGTSFPNLWR
jgi:Ca2+/Na+ antiporter